MRLLFDSAFVIDYLRGLPAARRKLRGIYESGDEPMINDIVVCEVRAGMRDDQAGDLMALLEPLDFIQPGPKAALAAGAWRTEARATGFHLSLGDALIASAAVSVDAAVLTRNVRDFALTPVRIETY